MSARRVDGAPGRGSAHPRTAPLAVLPVRGGVPPLGGDEVVAECAGRVLLAGSGTAVAAATLGALATEARCWEAGAFRPGAWAATLAVELAAEPGLVLPGSPDGRDLAARLAAATGRPLLAPALSVGADAVLLVRGAGLRLESVDTPASFVAVLQPGVRGVPPRRGEPPASAPVHWPVGPGADPEVLEELAADPATVDLADARRIVGAGAGLGSPELVDLARTVATALGASFGATRVVTDLGWAGVDRQIGTTGVVVDPDLYVALGVSGAVQHVSGLGRPGTVVAVNTDASCPMMALADLALVTDAPGLVRELAARLGVAVPQLEEAGRG